MRLCLRKRPSPLKKEAKEDKINSMPFFLGVEETFKCWVSPQNLLLLLLFLRYVDPIYCLSLSVTWL